MEAGHLLPHHYIHTLHGLCLFHGETMTFFTSDTHYGHANIIKYSGRPFKNADDMTYALKENHNAIVKPDDDVYHLGDHSYYDFNSTVDLLFELNGFFHYIFGNHDNVMKEIRRHMKRSPSSDLTIDLEKKIRFLGNMEEVEVEGINITLNHYAMKVWNRSHYGAWHLYGHSHGSLPDDPRSMSIDVGVDVHNYRPISFREVDDIMMKKSFLPIDHHGGDRQKNGGIGLGKEDYAKAESLRQYLMLQKEFKK
jgi:calcineurin-like phosphoesterase family protein